MDRAITVIIATTCEQKRADAIRRAVDSILSQQGVRVELLMVVNGSRYDPELFEELKRDARLRVFYREEGSFPAALRFGREQVATDYFSFVDDDDYLLPGALALRLEAIEAPSPVDFVASNGVVEVGDRTVPFVADPEAVEADPLGANIGANWLGSSAGLFRSSTVMPDYFDITSIPYEWTLGKRRLLLVNEARLLPSTVHEWTLLTFRLMLDGRRMRFVQADTFRKSDTPGSLSKDPGVIPLSCDVAMLESLRAVIPQGHAARFSAKLGAAWHALADCYWRHGNTRSAWLAHWKSLWDSGGWRHLPFTRRLVVASLLGAR